MFALTHDPERRSRRPAAAVVDARNRPISAATARNARGATSGGPVDLAYGCLGSEASCDSRGEQLVGHRSSLPPRRSSTGPLRRSAARRRDTVVEHVGNRPHHDLPQLCPDPRRVGSTPARAPRAQAAGVRLQLAVPNCPASGAARLPPRQSEAAHRSRGEQIRPMALSGRDAATSSTIGPDML